MKSRLNSVELFAGGGGMALGLRDAGFEHEALVEWWAPAARVLRHNAELHPNLWTKDHVIEADVRATLDRLSQLGPVNLVAGGPPCQPFSLAGAGAGDSDDRNMFPAALAVVRRLRPEYVVFENVPGLLRPSFAPYLEYVKDQLRCPDVEPQEGELWNEHHSRVRASELSVTYSVHQEEIDAADVGVAQNRKRIFLIAVRKDQPGHDVWPGISRPFSRDALLRDQWLTCAYWTRHRLPKPNDIPQRLKSRLRHIEEYGVPDSVRPWQTLRDLLATVPEPLVDRPQEGWPNHLAILGARSYAKHNGSPMDLPSKTIKAGVHGVAGGEAMLRELDGSVRYLSIREAALVQGFPRDYEFPGVRSRVMGVIGNAVAVDVAARVGRALAEMRRVGVTDE